MLYDRLALDLERARDRADRRRPARRRCSCSTPRTIVLGAAGASLQVDALGRRPAAGRAVHLADRRADRPTSVVRATPGASADCLRSSSRCVTPGGRLRPPSRRARHDRWRRRGGAATGSGTSPPWSARRGTGRRCWRPSRATWSPPSRRWPAAGPRRSRPGAAGRPTGSRPATSDRSPTTCASAPPGCCSTSWPWPRPLVERITQSQKQRDVAARMSYAPARPVASFIDRAL